MADTSKLSKEERKKEQARSAQEEESSEAFAKRDYARGSKKSKVKKLARGQAKR